MANKKISELDALTSVVSSDYIAIVDASTGVTKRAVLSDLPDTDTTYSVGDGGLTTNDFTNADHSKLNAIEASATADQSASEIKTLLEDGIDSVHYVDGSIDTAHIGANQVTAAKVAADVATQAELDTVSTVASAALPKAGGAMTGAITTNSTFDGVDIATRDAILTSTTTTAGAALPKAGGAMTGAITTNSTFDGVDIATRDGVLTSTTTTAAAALPKAGGTMTGAAVGATDTDTSNTGSVTLNFSTNQNFVLTLTGNVTLANPSTEQVGQSGFIAFIQDGTGSRTVSLGTDYETAAAAGLTLTSTASATDLVPYLVVASNRILLGTPQLAFA